MGKFEEDLVFHWMWEQRGKGDWVGFLLQIWGESEGIRRRLLSTLAYFLLRRSNTCVRVSACHKLGSTTNNEWMEGSFKGTICEIQRCTKQEAKEGFHGRHVQPLSWE